MPKPRIFPRFCKCWNLKKKEKVESKSDHHDEEVFERIDVNQIRMRDERSKSIEIRKVAHARLQSERAVN